MKVQVTYLFAQSADLLSLNALCDLELLLLHFFFSVGIFFNQHKGACRQLDIIRGILRRNKLDGLFCVFGGLRTFV